MPKLLKHSIIALLIICTSLYSMYQISQNVLLNIKLGILANHLSYSDTQLSGQLTGEEILLNLKDPYLRASFSKFSTSDFHKRAFNVSTQPFGHTKNKKFRIKISAF